MRTIVSILFFSALYLGAALASNQYLLVRSYKKIISGPPQSFIDSPCFQAAKDVALQITEDPLGVGYYLIATGKFVNGWGDYGTCNAHAIDSHYLQISITGNTPQGEPLFPQNWIRTGLCIPKGCNETIMEPLEGVFFKAAARANIQNATIVYSYPNEELAEKRANLPAGFYGTIALIIFLFIINGFGLVVHKTRLFDRSDNNGGQAYDVSGEAL